VRRTILDSVGDCLPEEHDVGLDDRVWDAVRFAICTGRNDERVVLDAPQIHLTSSVYQSRYSTSDVKVTHISIWIRLDPPSMRLLYDLLPRRIQLAQQILELVSGPHMPVLQAMYKGQCAVQLENPAVGFG
jgi:hypothetical protein